MVKSNLTNSQSSLDYPNDKLFELTWNEILYDGGLAAWIPQSAIPALFRPMTILFGDNRFEYIADFSASASGTLIIGVGVLLLAIFTITTSVVSHK